jgi:ppGpp synthetase/RelA/SpoT-type nucleotidyltranferase
MDLDKAFGLGALVSDQDNLALKIDDLIDSLKEAKKKVGRSAGTAEIGDALNRAKRLKSLISKARKRAAGVERAGKQLSKAVKAIGKKLR